MQRTNLPRCRYCGRPIAAGRTCRRCAPLEAGDPSVIAEQPPVSERELGIEPAGRVSDHQGRRELY